MKKSVIASVLATAMALGMTAGTVWDGKEQVNGGYIVVMESGDVLCYHSTDRESFRTYLYRNCHFEYVSTDKYNWGFILRSSRCNCKR